jgi:Tol biopolymer transport system component
VISGLVAPTLIAAVLGWVSWNHTISSQTNQTVKSIPLTTYPGVEKEPSLSPDGSQVAFSWNGPDQTNFDIYIKTTRSGSAVSALPHRLTQDGADDINPVWSPDGSSIAFLRKLGIGNRFGVLLIPALGGQERKLAEISIPQGLGFTCRTSRGRPTAIPLSLPTTHHLTVRLPYSFFRSAQGKSDS